MTLGKMLAIGLVGGSFLVGGALVIQPSAFAQQTAIKALDTDNDGTLDLDEATKAAGAVFDRLQKDQDDTLDRKELGSRVKPKRVRCGGPRQGQNTLERRVCRARDEAVQAGGRRWGWQTRGEGTAFASGACAFALDPLSTPLRVDFIVSDVGAPRRQLA